MKYPPEYPLEVEFSCGHVKGFSYSQIALYGVEELSKDSDQDCWFCKSWKEPPVAYETKDSGARQEYDSGMRRDLQDDKPRFDLLLVDGQPYEEQFLTRFAALLERGASKYGPRNWQLADSQEELDRFRASGLRHMMQWASGERDEDHAVAVAFNLMAYEYVQWKLKQETTLTYLGMRAQEVVNDAFSSAQRADEQSDSSS